MAHPVVLTWLIEVGDMKVPMVAPFGTASN